MAIHIQYFETLPYEILMKIFLKLPTAAVSRCMCVCKAWRNIPLKDSYFARRHLLKSKPNLLIFSGSNRKYDLVDIHESDSEKQVMNFDAQNWFPKDVWYMWNSCNGLILFSDISLRKFYVCNPIRRECVCLPKVQGEEPVILSEHDDAIKMASKCPCKVPLAGIGFCPKANQYKVIRFVKPTRKNVATTCEILTLGTDSWRNIGDVPCPCSSITFMIFLNGSFHWVDSTWTWICSLKIDEETLESVPVSQLRVTERNVDDEPLNRIRIIKKNNSWFMVFTANSKQQEINVTEDKSLVYFRRHEFGSYDQEKRILTTWKTRCFLKPGYTGSFISLKDVIMGAHLSG